MSEGELILYKTDDGAATIGLRAINGTVWLTQLEMAELFDTSKQNISLHLNNILTEGELVAESVVKESLTTAADGKAYRTKVYNLDAFLSFNERDVLTHAGRLRMDVAQKLAAERFDANRRAAEALAADADDIAQLEEMEKAARGRKKGGKYE